MCYVGVIQKGSGTLVESMYELGRMDRLHPILCLKSLTPSSQLPDCNLALIGRALPLLVWGNIFKRVGDQICNTDKNSTLAAARTFLSTY